MSDIRYYMDESVELAVSTQMAAGGIDVVSAHSLDKLGDTDPNHLARATRMGRVLCTYDQDFLRLAAEGAAHAGLIFAQQQKASIARVVRDDDLLWLVDVILAGGVGVLADEYDMVYFPGDDLFAVNRDRGLPIGNLTSQFWSNVYMNPLDWFVVGELGCKGYLRYVDDMALFSNSKRDLWAWKRAIIERLAQMRLTIHDDEAQVYPTRHGTPWLGFVVYPTHRKLKRRNAVNFTRRLEHNIDLYQQGEISFGELDASVNGWVNHVRYADTWGLRGHIFGNHSIRPPKKP